MLKKFSTVICVLVFLCPKINAVPLSLDDGRNDERSLSPISGNNGVDIPQIVVESAPSPNPMAFAKKISLDANDDPDFPGWEGKDVLDLMVNLRKESDDFRYYINAQHPVLDALLSKREQGEGEPLTYLSTKIMSPEDLNLLDPFDAALIKVDLECLLEPEEVALYVSGILSRDRELGLVVMDLAGAFLGRELSRVVPQFSSSNISSLMLDFCSLETEGILCLEGLLLSPSHVTHLSLSGNRVGDGGAAILGSALEQNVTLLLLNLNYNEIGAEGAVSLARGLGKNRALRNLIFSENSIGDVGAKAFATEVLPNHISLKKLDVSNNTIGIEGAFSVAQGLRANQALRDLNLSGNYIGDGGAMVFATEVFPSNIGLQKLDISNNGISRIVQTYIKERGEGKYLDNVDGEMVEKKTREITVMTETPKKVDGMAYLVPPAGENSRLQRRHSSVV